MGVRRDWINSFDLVIPWTYLCTTYWGLTVLNACKGFHLLIIIGVVRRDLKNKELVSCTAFSSDLHLNLSRYYWWLTSNLFTHYFLELCQKMSYSNWKLYNYFTPLTPDFLFFSISVHFTFECKIWSFSFNAICLFFSFHAGIYLHPCGILSASPDIIFTVTIQNMRKR